MRNSVRGLRTFCIAARYLSFKAAAEELCVTPSAVSHQIKALEQQLQALLFERRTREVALTELGASLFAQVGPLFAELDAITARLMRRDPRTVDGMVKALTPPSPAQPPDELARALAARV